MNKKYIFLIGLVVSLALNIYFIAETYLTKYSGIKVEFDVCGLKHTDTYIVKNDSVYVKTEAIDDKGVSFALDVQVLGDCTIIDSKNWKCGGKTDFYGSVDYHSPQYVVSDNKFSYFDGWSSPPNESDCKSADYRQLR